MLSFGSRELGADAGVRCSRNTTPPPMFPGKKWSIAPFRNGRLRGKRPDQLARRAPPH